MIILGKNTYFDNKYKQNANNLIIGAPGTGKSRSFVIPNLCEANNESVVVLDAKGEIYDITHKMMESKGFTVKLLDFDDPEHTHEYYNPLHYCRSEEDIIKLSTLITADQYSRTVDVFWPLSTKLLNNALVSYLISYRPSYQQTLESVMKLLKSAGVVEDSNGNCTSPLDKIFSEVGSKDPNAWCLGQYKLMKNAASKTQKSIKISLVAEFCTFMTPAISKLTSNDTINLGNLGNEKTALYVKCSDTDRSKDKLVSMFFTQLFHELFDVADKSPEHSLKRPVHVILDDLGSNLQVPDLDCIIACSRGRNISLSLILQSIGQLKKNYKDYTSILNSCNNVVFLGGNDIETCREMSLRLNKPLVDVLYKPNKQTYVFKQGSEGPIITDIYDMREHTYYPLLNDNWCDNTQKQTIETDCRKEIDYDNK